MTISIVVPTYRRPDQLLHCLDGLLAQSRPADELVVVRRDDDIATISALYDYPATIVEVPVHEPGVLAAMIAGMQAATGDIIAFIDDDELAFDAMREVGPGGHFFGCAHTQARYRTAFFAPMISDWRNYETWREGGSPTAYDTANRLYKEKLAAYREPPIEPDRLEAMQTFVARRKAEGGVKTDF